ncbi:MAG: radical SAM family heme chaperone HemW [Terriglobales bacterium]|jgi:putative oxygen-independent coproporphyrinogen III oxidase
MPLGLYISVPFCRTKCTYCNFASDVFSKAVFQRYVDRVCSDLAQASTTAAQMGGMMERAVASVYIGGGTPTILDISQMERLFVTIWQNFDLQAQAEITVECAPGTLTPPVIELFRRHHVNRVSLGVQSFVDQEASSVGRLHNRSTVLDDITRLRDAGISNLNLDLIAGLPHQTQQSWEFSLEQVIATQAPHVSVYMLEVDDDSRLGRELIAGGTKYHAHFVPDEDLTATLYETARDRLNAAGIRQYEISNFARSGFESRHNLKYWTRQPYLGFGIDAHSMLFKTSGTDAGEHITGGHDFSRADHDPSLAGFSPCGPDAVRFSTPDSLEQYVAGATLQSNFIDRHAALEETFFLGLRLNRGLDLGQVVRDFGGHELAPVIDELVQAALLERQGSVIRLTARGRLLSNEVFERFLAVSM